MMRRVKINHESLYKATIEVEGQDIAPLVAAYTIDATARDGAVLSIALTPTVLPEWSGKAEAQVSEELAALLVLIGWQPPVKGEVTETEISTMGGPDRVFLRSDGTYRTEPWHAPEPDITTDADRGYLLPGPFPHTHRASCHGPAGELTCGQQEA